MTIPAEHRPVIGDGRGVDSVLTPTEPATGSTDVPESVGQGDVLFGRAAQHDRRTWLEQSWWMAAGVILLLWAVQLIGYVTAFPWLAGVVAVLSLWGLGTILAGWLPPLSRFGLARSRALIWATVAMVLAALAIWSYLQVFQNPAYGTDEIAFDQYAAHLLVHGINPYTRSMAPAFGLFHVQPDGYTFHLDGSPVTTLSYPALAFLLYTPFLGLGLSTQIAVALNVIAWTAVIVLAFAVLPRSIRPMALVIGSLGAYVSYAVGGVTDTLFLPFLVGAVLAWNRFAFRQGWRAWLGPVLLGLAMAIKQTPWFVFPFLVVGVVAEARVKLGWKRALRAGACYAAIALGAFLVPNLTFMAAAPGAWIHDVLSPLLSDNVPAGQGLIATSLYLDLGGGSLVVYSVATVAVLVALLAIFAVTYPTLRRWAVLLPAVVLFFATRSYGSYLVELIPAALVAAVTVGEASQGRPWPQWRWVTGGGIAATGAAIAAALLVPSPLAVSVTSVQTTGQLATVEQVQVQVRNQSSTVVRPHFTLSSGDAVTAFWLVTHGPARLRPGQRASYTLQAPNFPSQPPITGGFQVVAFTVSPASVSHSASYLPTNDHVELVPDAINHVVPIGQVVAVRAEVVDALDRPVRRAGTPVYLGQIIYAQRGLQFGAAIINSGRPGETPITAYTNANGVATFAIRGTQASSNPVYFEANLVNSNHYYPYGYSQILPIRFSAGSTRGAGR